jgi:hypothetical protein
MNQEQRRMIFLGSIAAAVILAIIAVLFLTGNNPVLSGKHTKHALLFFALAAGALVIANFNRPTAALRR